MHVEVDGQACFVGIPASDCAPTVFVFSREFTSRVILYDTIKRGPSLITRTAKVRRKDTVFKLPTPHDAPLGENYDHTTRLESITVRPVKAPPFYFRLRLYHRYAAATAAAAAAAASAVCLVSTKSWTDVIFTLSPEDLSVKIKIDSLANEMPPGPSPYSFA
jgi:hypothetical protein